MLTCRHASANDADFAFDAAPRRDLGVLVGRVGDFADVGGVLEPHHAADSNKEADQESEDDADFAASVGDLELNEPRNREEEDDEIQKDVDRAADVGSESEVDAGACVFTIPLQPKI